MTRIIKTSYHRFIMFISLLLLSVYSFAQDKGIDVDINVKKDNQWYQQPWVWVVGGAVFILLLAAILRSNSKTE
ncbi:MAG TPA: hypothetical protein VF487_13095 [Chitinophagaceae bacterium]